jgi:DNA-binding CsgD family transcriptional regulator
MLVRTTTTAATADSGWSGLFRDAFRRSRNPMALTDAHRVQLDVNAAFVKLLGRGRDALVGQPIYEYVEGGPLFGPAEWEEALAEDEVTGEANVLGGGGETIAVQYAAYPETVTGSRLVLFVVLSVSLWGRHFRRDPDAHRRDGPLSRREQDVVHLIALGASGPEIAEELHLSHNTVRTHVSNSMAKLGARSRAHLVAKALGDGIAIAGREIVQP